MFAAANLALQHLDDKLGGVAMTGNLIDLRGHVGDGNERSRIFHTVCFQYNTCGNPITIKAFEFREGVAGLTEFESVTITLPV